MMQPRSGLSLLGVAALFAAAGLAMAGAPGQYGGRGQSQESRSYSLDPAWVTSFGGVRTFADPSKDSQMGFTFPTEVREILVKVGDRVEKGDVLVRARDNEAAAAIEVQRARAENRYEIDWVQNALDLARIEFGRVEELRGGGGSSPYEYDRAENAVKAGEIDLNRAKERLREQQLQLARLEADLERYYLVAPYDGVVQDVMVSEGESTNESRPALRLVKVDPLYLRTPEEATRVRQLGLELGDPAWVILNLPGDQQVREGRVIAISPVTETGSQRLIVKVEVPNPDGVTAGLLAWVRFEPPEDEYWKSRMAASEAAEGDQETDASAAGQVGATDPDALTSEQVSGTDGGRLAGDGV
jgi:RND family efflux transporter MFP subunit